MAALAGCCYRVWGLLLVLGHHPACWAAIQIQAGFLPQWHPTTSKRTLISLETVYSLTCCATHAEDGWDLMNFWANVGIPISWMRYLRGFSSQLSISPEEKGQPLFPGTNPWGHWVAVRELPPPYFHSLGFQAFPVWPARTGNSPPLTNPVSVSNFTFFFLLLINWQFLLGSELRLCSRAVSETGPQVFAPPAPLRRGKGENRAMACLEWAGSLGSKIWQQRAVLIY